MKNSGRLLMILLGIVIPWMGFVHAAGSLPSYLRALAFQMELASKPVHTGIDGWLFSIEAVRGYGNERFWRFPANDTLSKPAQAILDLNAQLKARGIRLLVVPVPGKISFYADKLDKNRRPLTQAPQGLRALYGRLRDEGVDVLDLHARFYQLRSKGVDPYCRQDSRWSPAGLSVAAQEIAAWYRVEHAEGLAPSPDFSFSERFIDIRGDLLERLPNDEPKSPERLKARVVRWKGHPVGRDRRSPLLVMGDSHVLVYHAGLLGRDAGLPDQLAAALGRPVDLSASDEDGINAPRRALARRGDNLTGKRAVVWVFSVNAFATPSAWEIIRVFQ